MTDDELTEHANCIAWSFPKGKNSAWANIFAERSADMSSFAQECASIAPTIASQYQTAAAFASEQAILYRLACLYSYD